MEVPPILNLQSTAVKASQPFEPTESVKTLHETLTERLFPLLKVIVQPIKVIKVDPGGQ